MRPRIFIGSSRERIDICYVMQEVLEPENKVRVWDQDVFRLTHSPLDSLLDALDSSDAGVFVLTPDDLTESRGQSSLTVRDNVIFELGMFLGRLGRHRTFMLTPAKYAIRLPSDLSGIVTAEYDAERFHSEPHAAVGPACRRIRQALKSRAPRPIPEPGQARLNQAIHRMSKDLKYLFADQKPTQYHADIVAQWPGAISVQLERRSVRIEVGRIQDYHTGDTRTVIALPANEYFDDKCISDEGSSLGAFVQRHFKDTVADFKRQVNDELAGVPSQRVASEERRAESYGIGEAIFLSELQPDYRLILVSATTDRTPVGVHAEPHFLYAALEGIVETMNKHRLNSLVMPVLGSGHGEMPLPTAILFNLLAVRSILADQRGAHVREVRIVVFSGNAANVGAEMMRNIISRVVPSGA